MLKPCLNLSRNRRKSFLMRLSNLIYSFNQSGFNFWYLWLLLHSRAFNSFTKGVNARVSNVSSVVAASSSDLIRIGLGKRDLKTLSAPPALLSSDQSSVWGSHVFLVGFPVSSQTHKLLTILLLPSIIFHFSSTFPIPSGIWTSRITCESSFFCASYIDHYEY